MPENESFTLADLPEWFLKRENSIQEIRRMLFHQASEESLRYHFGRRFIVVGFEYMMYSFEYKDDLFFYCASTHRVPIFIYDQEDKIYMRAVLKLETEKPNLT